MRSLVVVCSLALAAMLCRADWEASLRPWMYASSFEKYEEDEPLSNDKGVSGGSWTVPADAVTAAVSSEDSRVVMSLSTSLVNGLVFTPDAEGTEADKAVVASMQMTAFQMLPEVDAKNDRAAIVIYQPEGSAATFCGWSAAGWKALALPSGLVSPVSGEWYDVSIRLMADAEGNAKVQYRIFNGNEYEPLKTADGTFWLDVIGTGSTVQAMELNGYGNFEYLKGSEMKDGLVVGVSKR